MNASLDAFCFTNADEYRLERFPDVPRHIARHEVGCQRINGGKVSCELCCEFSISSFTGREQEDALSDRRSL